MGAREAFIKKLTVKDWEKILRQALDQAYERKLSPNYKPNNYGTPFYLIPRKPESDDKKNG
jgi:hypothetical protein